ncbi:MAG: hydroxymethylbilane synthase [Actinomycetota bacterium]|jgi:hydroxymethylbilane synthase|nr:hydroxymethylbilane synthase [Actinomycetota bacterium]
MAGPPAGLRAATRASTLARVQTAAVSDMLAAAWGIEVEAVVVDTVGDRRTDAPIWAIGGQGVFVKEVQAAVLDGRADIAVHSSKDLPSKPSDGMVIAAFPPRADPRDALVGGRLADLPPGARIGTGSIRRRAQLAWLRPDLTFAGLRGNMETRLAKAAGFDAIVVAAAALQRLGRSAERTDVLDPELVVPQVGQGAMAVECREDDTATRDLLAAIDDRPTRLAVEAERAFLREVGGSCDLPVGAYATIGDGDTIRLEGMLATGDGRIVIRRRDEDSDPVELGRLVARYLLDDAGGADLLDVGIPASR